MKRPAVFMDRDGTINEQMGYINHISRFVILPGTAEAIRLLNKTGFLAIIVTNQSGVARGYFPVELVDEVRNHLRLVLQKEDAVIDDILFCPHYPKEKVEECDFECNCRKPKPGLIQKACRKFDIDMDRSYVIGDRVSDIELAKRCRLKGVLVKTGYGKGDLAYVFPNRQLKPFYVAKDLLAAVRWIIKDDRREKN